MENDKQQALQAHIKKLVAAIDATPTDATNYLELSALLLEQKAYSEAIELLEKAHAVVEKPQELDFNLAVAYYYAENYDKALAILASLPVDDAVLYQEGLIYFKLGEVKKALAHVLTMTSGTNASRELLADIWLALGDSAEAAKLLLQIEEARRNSKVWFMLGVAQSANEKELAEHSFSQSKKLNPEYFTAAMQQYESLLALVKGKSDD